MKSIWIVILSGIAIIGVAVIWTITSSEPPEWKEVQQLQEELQTSMETDPDGSSESDTEKESRETRRWEKMAEYREKLNALPEKLQKAAKDQMRGMFVSRMEQRIDRVLSLPAEERDEELDKQIDEWDRRIASWEKRRQQENTADKGENGDNQANNSGNAGGTTAGNEKKKSGRRRGWMNASKEQRDTWRRELLSKTTPEQRAKWHEYRRLMDERRKERGLSTRSF